ncbi:MAG: serine/threonine protein kinase [Planctomycetes bacterium]|nr:serine/threonine protein kinase [Planctomycetota bacterium]
MSPAAEAPDIKISVACGPAPCDSEEGRSFLQKRQALFGLVCFLLAAAHYIFINVLSALTVETTFLRWFTSWGNALHLGICAVFLAVYLLCRSGSVSRFLLALIDVGSLLAVGILLGLNASADGFTRHSEFVGPLLITNAVLARAVIVPSSGGQTLFTSVLAAIPVLIGSHHLLSSGAAVSGGGDPSAVGAAGPEAARIDALLSTSVLAVWCGVTAAIASVGSRIIYGLQQEVREARQLGQYSLEEKIGEGGMGEVYRASHAMLRRPTAIKLLRPERAGEVCLARFEREVQLTSRLTHPNTISIYDYGRTPDGVFYYAMEYLDGLDLESLVKLDGPQPPARAIHILQQACGSLIEAHAIGLIHRDIKPANIILCERGTVLDTVKVVDFGLVKDIEGRLDTSASGADTITGTPLYMSPEAIRSPQQVDGRSDIYALGAVGYFLLAGRSLFHSTNFMEICSHHLQTPPDPPSAARGVALPADLENLILRCLEKRPEDRPASARDLRRSLERLQDSGRWTQEDAARWWSSMQPRIDRLRPVLRTAPPGPDTTRSVEAVEGLATGSGLRDAAQAAARPEAEEQATRRS